MIACKLLAKGDGVFAGGFGNEGTGGHSHLIYPWKVGETYRFLVSAEPGGYAYGLQRILLTFRRRRHGDLLPVSARRRMAGYLHGLYSFNENFGGANGGISEACRVRQPVAQAFGRQNGLQVDHLQSSLGDGHWKGRIRLDYASGVEKCRRPLPSRTADFQLRTAKQVRRSAYKTSTLENTLTDIVLPQRRE